MIQVWPTVERFLTEHGAAVLVTLAQVQGSSPREAGARMMVRPDGRFSGTIGGGALEWLALAEAQSMMSGPGAAYRRLDKALGPELGQCCGGRVLVTLERFGAGDLARVGLLAAAERVGGFTTIADPAHPTARTTASPDLIAPGVRYAQLADGRIVERFGVDATALYLFGAGHVGQHLVLALAPLPFAVTWIDPRAGAFPSHVPANVELPRRQRAGAPARSGARRRVRRHHDPQPRARSRRRGGGAQGAALSLCRPDRQRHQARTLREHAAPARARAARTSVGWSARSGSPKSTTRRRRRSQPRSPRSS